MVMVMEDLGVAEDPPNMRYRSSTFRHGGFAYLADRSAMVRYVGGGGEIARYAGGGDGIRGVGGGEHAGEHVGEDADGHVGEHGGEDLGEGLDEDRDEEAGEDLCVCFWHSSRKCRCSWFFDGNTISQSLQDGLLHMFSCVCRMRRAIEENEALQSLQWW